MGLLDATPDDWFELYRRAAQNRSPNDGSGDTARGSPPSWRPRSQRAPLSLAGPDLAANDPWPSAPAARVVTVPQAGQPADLPSWAQRVKVEASNNLDYVPAFREGDGSGAASRKMLSDVNVPPEMRAAMNNKPYIPVDARDRFALD